MRTFYRDDKAVSPVIGVILMVAITVILAAVIGAFVFGMGSSVKKTYIVMATGERVNASVVRITFQGGQDAAQVGTLQHSVTFATNGTACGTTAYTWLAASTVVGGTNVTNCKDVGENPSATDKLHIVVTATFADGTTQSILSTDV